MTQLHSMIHNSKKEMISSLQQFIQIPSIEDHPKEGKPFGEGVDNALRFILKLGEDMGFKTKYADGYYGYIEMGAGDVLIGLLAHLDVVPTGDPNQWTYPPFKGEIHNNRLYGRGAIDDKGPLIATLYAMKAIKGSGMPLNKRVRLILGTNEETHWRGIKKYKQQEEAPHYGFTPDSDFPLINAEKGLIQIKLSHNESAHFSLKGGTSLNSVADYCEYKGNIHFIGLEQSESIKLIEEGDCHRIIFHGKSVHSAKSWQGLNAIGLAAKTLYKHDIRTNLMDFMANEIGLDCHGRNIFQDFEDEVSGKISINMGKVNFDEKLQELYLDIRYPVTKSKEEVLMHLQQKSNKYHLTLEEIDALPALYVPEEHFLVNTLKTVYTRSTNQDSTPITTGGATYARAFKNFVAFGPLFPGEEKLAHQRDEYIKIDSLMKCCHIYRDAIIELLHLQE